jgi:hypothetical protein
MVHTIFVRFTLLLLSKKMWPHHKARPHCQRSYDPETSSAWPTSTAFSIGSDWILRSMLCLKLASRSVSVPFFSACLSASAWFSYSCQIRENSSMGSGSRSNLLHPVMYQLYSLSLSVISVHTRLHNPAWIRTCAGCRTTSGHRSRRCRQAALRCGEAGCTLQHGRFG